MDVRSSRVAKLDTIPPEWLLLVARSWLFDSFDYCHNFNTSVAHVTKILESSAMRGNVEAGWLLQKMRSAGVIPEFGGDHRAKREWLAKIMLTDISDPWGQYYWALAFYLGNNRVWDDVNRYWSCPEAIRVMQLSAESGFAPAMSFIPLYYNDFCPPEQSTKYNEWRKKGIELNDPDSLYYGDGAVIMEVCRLLQREDTLRV